ncbi:MAG: hypothetical protein ACTHMM_18880 [Agriterribacter sp.]
MKQILFYAVAICLYTLNAGCRHGNAIVVNNGKDYLEINYTGKIKFTEDEAAIESMSSDAFLKFRNNRQKLYAESNYHGEVEYELYDDGKRIDPLEPRGRKLMAEMIKKMIDVGFMAEERVRSVYEKGGNIALLKASLNVQGDYLKGMYLSYMLSHGDPDSDELVGAAQITAKVMEAAFEKAQLLKKFSPQSLQDQAVALEWLTAAATIDADFERAQVLKEFPLNELDDLTVAAKWLNVAKTINADFEKSQVLKEFPVSKMNELPVSTAWFEAVRTINADFEKANTLKIVTSQPLNNEQFSEVLITAGGITAEFEQINLIKELIQQKVPSSAELFDQLMVSVRNIDADFEKANLLKAIAEKDIQTEAQWTGIIQETKTVNADFEKAGVLLLIAQKMPRTDQLNTAYLDAAKTIQSEMDYGRVVKAVD